MKSLSATLAVLLSLSLVRGISSQIPGQVYQDGAGGSVAVLLTIRELQRSLVFGVNHDFLRRIAFVETRDGTVEGTFGERYRGGIWAVKERKFRSTQNLERSSRLAAKLQQIEDAFNINWLNVNWNDLSRPLYGAIAAGLVLFLAPAPIPPSTDLLGQAQFWARHYNGNGNISEFLSRSTGLEGNILESAANEFFLGFSKNHIEEGGNTIPSLRLFISTFERHPVEFNVTANDFFYHGIAMANTSINVSLPSSLEVVSNSLADRNKGVHVKAEGDSKLVVYGMAYEPRTSDAYLALPCDNLAVDEYEYYGITYPDIRPIFTSDILIVGCEDGTVVTTPNGTFTVNRLETHLISRSDTTGMKVTSNKPISFFSNQECTDIPANFRFCDWLSEQIPPTLTWGKSFLMASLLGRNSGERVRILASENATVVTVNCTTFARHDEYTLSTSGSYIEFVIRPRSFCYVESSGPVLVMQFSQGNSLDGIGDPFMMMIPPVEQYSNNYALTVLPEFATNYITVYVAAKDYQPQRIFVDGASLISSLWTAVYCTNNLLCGYITRVSLTPGEHSLFHENPEARVGVSAYGFTTANSYGYPGGLRLTPIQLALVSFDSLNYSVIEAEGSVRVNITRTGNTEVFGIVLVATDDVQGTASVTEDYTSVSTILQFFPGETRKTVTIPIHNDRRIERNETFELYMLAGEGVHLSPFRRAVVTIENDDGGISISPPYGSVLGGTGVTITGDMIRLEEQYRIICTFDGIPVAGIYVSQSQGFCISPSMERTGQVELAVSIVGPTVFSGETTFTSLPFVKAFDIYLENDNLLFSEGTEVQVRWSPLTVFPLEFPRLYTVDIDMLEMRPDGTRSKISLAMNVPNIGSADVLIPNIIETESLEDSISPVIIQVSLSGSSLSRSRGEKNALGRLDRLAKKTVLNSPIRYLRRHGTKLGQRALCELWNTLEPDNIGQEILSRVPPCPRRIQDIRIPNSGFTEERFSSILPVVGDIQGVDRNTQMLGNEVSDTAYTLIDDNFREFFHPGASNCFRQRVTDPTLTRGSGQQCCYNNDGFLVVGPPGGGTVDRYSPDVDLGLHLIFDVIPYLLCCKAGEFSNCDLYYRNRPSDRGIDYTPPPPPAIIRGDPHIATLDGHQYTFNGKGEFALINTQDGRFSLQARMVPINNTSNNSMQATVFTAVVVKQNNSDTVQIEIVNDNISVLINGVEIDFTLLKEQEFANVTVSNVGNSTYAATFSSGAYVEVEEENGIFSTLAVSLPKLFQESRTSGLMGSFNGNKSDDLLPNSASTPLSINSSLQDIHELFGITWIIDTPSNSLFTYQPGESWATYYDPFFTPIYSVVFSNSALEQEARDLCGDDNQCLFDVAATGRTDIGLSTLQSNIKFNEILQLQTPVICTTPCAIGVCVANDTCYCASGYEGTYCTELVFGECETNPCQNGGECRKHVLDYFCICPLTATGDFCETVTIVEGPSTDEKLSTAVIIGIVVGILCLLLLVLTVAVVLILRFRRKVIKPVFHHRDQVHYFSKSTS